MDGQCDTQDPGDQITLIRYRIVGDRPRITEAVRVAESFREAVLSVAGRRLGFSGIPSALSGKKPDGENCADNHAHAHFYCEPEFRTGAITHLCLSVPAGIDTELLPVLASVDRFWCDRSLGYLVEPDECDPRISSRLCLEAREWSSLTPFVPGRHLRIRRSERHDRTGHDAALERELVAQVRSELSLRGFPQPEEVLFDRSHGVRLGDRFLRWGEFRRWRSTGAPQSAARYGHGFHLRFAAPVKGPISIGYASHFGLGLFMPASLFTGRGEASLQNPSRS